ncbi:hypothetical protein [Klebsiella michiganensis]|uniref:hypothetical protein n=1 Tax=Klebsiella michiganensis TaxID=1134687 RepID=UPI00292D8928|nr:hypothetical protein [Klebsiella michiganensis]
MEKQDLGLISVTNTVDEISRMFVEGIIPPEGSKLEVVLFKKKHIDEKCSITLKLQSIQPQKVD